MLKNMPRGVETDCPPGQPILRTFVFWFLFLELFAQMTFSWKTVFRYFGMYCESDTPPEKMRNECLYILTTGCGGSFSYQDCDFGKARMIRMIILDIIIYHR